MGYVSFGQRDGSDDEPWSASILTVKAKGIIDQQEETYRGPCSSRHGIWEYFVIYKNTLNPNVLFIDRAVFEWFATKRLLHLAEQVGPDVEWGMVIRRARHCKTLFDVLSTINQWAIPSDFDLNHELLVRELQR